MIEKGVETRRGIGRHLLEKLTLYGYGGAEGAGLKIDYFDREKMTFHILFALNLNSAFDEKVLEAVATRVQGEVHWSVWEYNNDKALRSEFISPFSLTGKRFRENV
jgi:hypothetical protein